VLGPVRYRYADQFSSTPYVELAKDGRHMRTGSLHADLQRVSDFRVCPPFAELFENVDLTIRQETRGVGVAALDPPPIRGYKDPDTLSREVYRSQQIRSRGVPRETACAGRKESHPVRMGRTVRKDQQPGSRLDGPQMAYSRRALTEDRHSGSLADD